MYLQEMKCALTLLLFSFVFGFSQSGLTLVQRPKAVIPFQLINNLIFIKLKVNGVDLTFLVDSGVSETILFSLDDKEISFNKVEKIKFSGLGENADVEGLHSTDNIVSIGKFLSDAHHSIYIILDENINFSSHVGIPVNGIIGYQLFKNNVVDINFKSKKMTFLSPEKFKKKRVRNFVKIPLTFTANKPYVMTEVEIQKKRQPAKMLLDLGNSDAVWLFPQALKDDSIMLKGITDYLGRGFSGDIYGERARIKKITLADYEFKTPIVAIPETSSIRSVTLAPERKGSIGNEILRRFRLIFDYQNATVFLRPNGDLREAFLFNGSGMAVQHDGMQWAQDLVKIETRRTDDSEIPLYKAEQEFRYKFVLKPQFSVASCRENSPCSVAGIRRGDRLISVNKKRAGELTLEKINHLLRGPDGTPVSLLIERDGRIIQLQMKLKDPIPYPNEN